MPEYTFDTMVASLRSAMGQFPDIRTGKNTQYEVMDAASGAFSVFFTQCPSFLQHQKLMQEKYGLSNAKTLFGMKAIPSDNQIRNLLDQVPPASLASVFQDCFNTLQNNKYLDAFQVEITKDKQQLLIALDGTQYSQSDTINCENCSTKVKDGKEFFAHTVVTPTIVAPGMNKVISLMPEYITPQDGDKKQDCELKASKRWLEHYGDDYSSLGITMLGDDLYAHEPFVREVLKKEMNFIFVCKPESHKTLYEWVKGITKEKVEDRFDGKTHLIYTYNYAEGVPLKDGKDSLLVNFVEVTVKDRQTKKQLYHNAFITNNPLAEETLATIIDCGRARWKIENENNNTLKRQGYNLEHNFGHGKKHLASLLATMNILAFLFHTCLEFMNEKYQWLREVSGARKRLFESIRVLLIYIPAQSFDHFLTFMIESLKHPRPIEELKFPV
jgi:hypothetical protein